MVSVMTLTILAFVLVNIYLIAPLGAMGRQEAAILSPITVVGAAAYLTAEIRTSRARARSEHDSR